MNSEEKLYFQNSNGDNLCGILNIPDEATKESIIILCHGHSSHKNTQSFVRLRQLLEKRRIVTFRFDFYGHGESDGDFANATETEATDDILQAIKFLKNRGYNRIGLVGSSFGGLASLLAASKTNDLCFLVLKSPVSNHADLYSWRGISIDDWKKKGYRDYPTKTGMLKLNYKFYEDALKNDGYKAAPKVKIPTLIVHGSDDQEVSFAQSKKTTSLIPNSELKIITGADHTYTHPNHHEEMSQTIATFIENQISNRYVR